MEKSLSDIHDNHNDQRVSTGVPGLDEIPGGGLTPSRVYLVEGAPDAGKTTLALQFLLDGQRFVRFSLHGEATVRVAAGLLLT